MFHEKKGKMGLLTSLATPKIYKHTYGTRGEFYLALRANGKYGKYIKKVHT